MKRTVQFLCLLMMVALVAGSLSAFAEKKKMIPKKSMRQKAPAVQGPYVAKFPVDPYIYVVCADKSFCDQALGSVNAMLLQNISVVVGNHQCPDKPRHKATGEVTVSFYNYRAGRVVTRTKRFSVNTFDEQKILVFPGKYLVKKSTGITARITKINAPGVDCNIANNAQTVKQWKSCAVLE